MNLQWITIILPVWHEREEYVENLGCTSCSYIISELKGLCIEKMELCRMCNPDSAARLQNTQELSNFLDTWASAVSTQYNTEELKSEYTQLLLSTSGSDLDGKQVILALVPIYLRDFLKSYFSVY